MSEEQTVRVEPSGPVTWIRMNRPKVKNAITPDVARQITSALEQAEASGTRVVVLTGAGGSFCSGADLKAGGVEIRDAAACKAILIDAYHPLLLTMARLPMPIIAAVDGIAVGIGCDIALAADLRIASERAAFSQIFVQVGLIPDGGGTFTLQRMIGTTRAMEMAMTGRMISAEQAMEWGIVNHVYPTEGFEDRVRSYAEELSAKAPLAVARAKKAIRDAADGITFEQALNNEATIQEELFGSKDFAEGVEAFVEKRKPSFKGC